MQNGKMNVILDCFWGSSGKGKVSAYLADRFGVSRISSSNFPNAGHTAAFSDGTKFIAKAIPTAAILRRVNGVRVDAFVSPGSGFHPAQLSKEWLETGRPNLFIHSRASIVTSEHAARENTGGESTKHIASTMQGSGTAYSDKILRKADVKLAGTPGSTWMEWAAESVPPELREEFFERVRVVDAFEFRNLTHSSLEAGHAWLHEGSQGYALSLDHGSHFPYCTSRNCTVQAAMDHMAVPPSLIGDVYLNLRTHPIRVGNVVEDGVQKGFSGDFYPDCKEMTWAQVATESGMPAEEAALLAERERTTVTKRIRRVSTFSFVGLRDAVRVNGATKLCLNFVQYIDWADRGKFGGPEAYADLTSKTRAFVEKIEDAVGLPVVLIGTGPLHGEMIDRMPR